MKIIHVAAECAPMVQVGGLGEVVAALTQGLVSAGHEVELFLPAYPVLDRSGLESHGAGPIERLRIGQRTFEYFLDETLQRDSGVAVRLISCPDLYGLPAVYSGDADEPWRYALLAEVALRTAEASSRVTDVAHCHDWHAALAVAAMGDPGRRRGGLTGARSVLTLHNLAYQGVFGLDVAETMDLGGFAVNGRLNFLESGIRAADLVTTVSPTYAEEIQSQAHGAGLEALLRERRNRLVGVLNGVGPEWNPARDARLPANYSSGDLSGKAVNRRRLLEHAGLPADGDKPILATISRLVEQKGCDLYREGFGELLERRDALFVAVGLGEPRYEALFSELERAHPERVAFFSEFNLDLSHLVEAGSDVFLMPSRFEPCGLNQMYSMLYGTVPVVHSTGGLVDTVTPFDRETGEGTGFVFHDYAAKPFLAAIEEALDLYGERDLWSRLVQNGMNQDFSWKTVVALYEQLYTSELSQESLY